MPKYTQQQLEEKYDNLPEDLRAALFNVDIANKMFEIGKKNRLTIEETGNVSEEAGLVILGLEKPQNLLANIKNRLNLDESEIKKIVHDVNEQVFFPLREALRKAHNIDIEGGETPRTPQPPAPVRAASPESAQPVAPSRPRTMDIPSSPPGVFPQPRVSVPAMSKSETVSPAKKLEELMTKTVPPPSVSEASMKKQESREEIKAERVPFSALSEKKVAPAGQTDPIAPKPVMPEALPPSLAKAMEGKAKIPPIDLRQIGKEASIMNQVSSKNIPSVQKSEKQKPYSGTDPYKEPIE